MAMNPQTVLSSLRMMSDQQLQQYAAMHKNDPFVFPLAFQESQMRKQMRSEAQATQAGPQPKVADQALASMAEEPMPEEVGIGALPAQNLEGMAAGGIVAFDEGGEVPRYNGQTGSSIYSPEGIPLTGIPGDMTDSDLTILERLGVRNPANRRALEAATKKPVAPVVSSAYTPSVENMLGPATRAAPADQGGKPVPPTGSPLQQLTMPRFTPSTAPAVPTAASMRERLNQVIGETPAEDPFKQQRQGITEQGLAGARKQQQMLEEEIAARGEAFKGREERLSKREEKITKDTDQNAGLAFLEAGLAIMGGSSPFALQNVALGTKGIEAYAKGKDKIDAARERLDDARDRIEEYRRNEDMMNSRERRQAQAGIDNLLTQGKRDLLQGAEQAYGRQTQLGTAVFGALNQAENTARVTASHEKVAGMQIAAQRDLAASNPERVVWNSLMQASNNDPVAAMHALNKLKAEKFNVVQSYADYIKAYAGKENVTSAPLDFLSYAAQFNVPSFKGSDVPENANIRKLPK